MPLPSPRSRTLLLLALAALVGPAGCVVNPVPTPGTSNAENDDRKGPGGATDAGRLAGDAFAGGVAEAGADGGKQAAVDDATAAPNHDDTAASDASAWTDDALGPADGATATDAAAPADAVTPTDATDVPAEVTAAAD